ncbi:MAG: RNA-binding protein, partial [Flavobacterium sp.]|nr:RNA-binding protein [Flavobacterium sp.]
MKKNYALLFALFFTYAVSAQSSCAAALEITSGSHSMGIVDGSGPTLYCVTSGTATAALWYKYIPTEDYSVTVTTDLPINNGKDTRFHVYSGTCASLVCVAGDDDSGSGFLSVANFNVTAGTTYIIAFDNRWLTLANNVTFQLIENAPAEPEIPVEQIAVPVSFTTQVVSILGTYKNGV